MVFCHQGLPTRTRHFMVRDASYGHLGQRKRCVKRSCRRHGLMIIHRTTDVQHLSGPINSAGYRDYAEALGTY
jgi:hypothetical protein